MLFSRMWSTKLGSLGSGESAGDEVRIGGEMSDDELSAVEMTGRLEIGLVNRLAVKRFSFKKVKI
jgi:hypothetical protein